MYPIIFFYLLFYYYFFYLIMFFTNNYNTYYKNIITYKNIFVYFHILNKLSLYLKTTSLDDTIVYKQYILNLDEFEEFYLFLNYFSIKKINSIYKLFFFNELEPLYNLWGAHYMNSGKQQFLKNFFLDVRLLDNINIKKKSTEIEIKKSTYIKKKRSNFKFFFLYKSYFFLGTSQPKLTFNVDPFQKKRILTFLNLLFIEDDDTEEDPEFLFIFTYENLLTNFNYIFTYLNNYRLIKLITNEINLDKWTTVFDIFEYYDELFFNKNYLFKNNFISINYLPTDNDFFLERYFLIYQLKSIFWLINTLLFKMFKLIFTQNSFLININKYDFDDYDDFKDIIYNNYNNYNTNYIYTLIDTILIIIIYKDPQILIRWVQFNMSILFYKKHNNFINLLKNIFIDIFDKYSEENNFLGYKIVLKGKLNKLGNVRKRKIIVTKGITTLSNINYKSDFISDIILTSTGVINIKITINYL